MPNHLKSTIIVSLLLLCQCATNETKLEKEELTSIAGQKWSAKSPLKTHEEAIAYCANLSLRLPTASELLAVYTSQKYFPGDGYENSSYWSSEKGIFVHAGNQLSHPDPERRAWVRCVE